MKRKTEDSVYFRECCIRLMTIIDFGEDNALTQKQITELTGFSRSFTEKLIKDISKRNVVICSSNRGRFYPENAHELKSYIRRLGRDRKDDERLISAKAKLKALGRSSGGRRSQISDLGVSAYYRGAIKNSFV